jgi:hypothetical protein
VDASGEQRVTGGTDGEVVVLDAATLNVSARWRAHRTDVTALALVTPERLVTGATGELHLRDVPKRKTLATETLKKGQFRELITCGRAVISTSPLAVWSLV